MSHLVEEALRLGARFVCPVDDEVLDVQGTKDPRRWGHLNRERNEWHLTGPEPKEISDGK